MASKLNIWSGVAAALIGAVIALIFTQFQVNVWLEPLEEEQTAPILEAPIAPTTQPAPTAPASPVQRVPGALRVSNQTTYPIRLVLLGQTSSVTASAFNAPVHWDFAPNEGGSSGLILSLPTGNLRLKAGDVLMGFSLDGSRRYWGPYVVGDTALPKPQGQPPEWQLTFQP